MGATIGSATAATNAVVAQRRTPNLENDTITPFFEPSTANDVVAQSTRNRQSFLRHWQPPLGSRYLLV
jgi:hypothetical protein